jgi:hypothetical protein
MTIQYSIGNVEYPSEVQQKSIHNLKQDRAWV